MEPIFVISEYLYTDTYWYSNTYEGLKAGALKNGAELINYPLEAGMPLPEGLKEPLVLLGTSISWIRNIVGMAAETFMRCIVVGSGSQWEEHDSVSCIRLDFRMAMIDIVKYLRGCGKKQIAMVGVNRASAADMEKQRYFLAALRQFEFSDPNDDIYFCDGSITNSIGRFLAFQNKYDAVVCPNDIAALELLHRVSSPNPLFVVGFGATLIGRLFQPSLTTVTLDYNHVGHQAVTIWNMLHGHPGIVSVSCSVACRIIPRESTAFYPVIPSEKPAVHLSPSPVPQPENSFYDDSSVIRLLGLETLFQHMDLLDFQILRGIWQGLSYEVLSETLHVSDGTVKYRLKRMLKYSGFSSKSSLLEHLSAYFNIGFLDRLGNQKT